MSFLLLLVAVIMDAQAVCPAAEPIKADLTCSTTLSGQTIAERQSNLRRYKCSGGRNLTQDYGEDVYAFKCQADGPVRLLLTGMQCDLDIYVLNDSCSPGRGCIGVSDAPSTTDDSVTFQCTKGKQHYIVIEDFNCRGNNPNYTLQFAPEGGCKEDCDDGKDNDEDGPIDCDDSDCADDPACAKKDWGPICDQVPDVTLPLGAPLSFTVPFTSGRAPDQVTLNIAGRQHQLVEAGSYSYSSGNISIGDSELIHSATVVASLAGEADKSCDFRVIYKPWVELQANPGSPVDIGPATLTHPWFPYGYCEPEDPALALQRDPNNICRDACGGAITSIDLSATQSQRAFDGTYTVQGFDLDPGLEVYRVPTAEELQNSGGKSDSFEPSLQPFGVPVPFTFEPNDPGTHRVDLAVCGKRCPLTGEVKLGVTVEARDVYSRDGSGPGDQRQELQLTANVEASSWWTCYGWAVLTAAGIVMFSIWVYGFLWPLRFPKPGRLRSNFPAFYNAVDHNGLDGIYYSMVATDLLAPIKTWYRDEKLFLGANLSLSKHPGGAQAVLELRREKETKLHRCWIIPQGVPLMCAPYIEGQSLRAYIPSLVLVEPEGEPLKLDHIYVIKRDTWCAIFSNSSRD